MDVRLEADARALLEAEERALYEKMMDDERVFALRDRLERNDDGYRYHDYEYDDGYDDLYDDWSSSNYKAMAKALDEAFDRYDWED